MRYLVTVKLKDGTFIYLIPEFSQAICLQWKSERSYNLSSTTNIRSRWVFPSPFNLDICTVNCTTETERIQREEVALKPLVFRWSVEWRLRLSEVIVILQNLIVAVKLQLRITSQMCHFALSGKCERWKTSTVIKLLSRKHLGVFRNLMCLTH